MCQDVQIPYSDYDNHTRRVSVTGYSGRKNIQTIRLFIHIVYISQKKGVYMFYDLNQDDSICLQLMI
jgi:hypothetical protein